MDWSAIASIATSITTARDIAKGIATGRDAALINEKTAALMDQLLKAQDGLLTHNAALLQLQADLAEAQQKVRELQTRIEERANYTLFELKKGHFALRYTPINSSNGAGHPGSGEPPHYICQPCFSIGKTTVLQRAYAAGYDNGLICPTCKTQVFDE